MATMFQLCIEAIAKDLYSRCMIICLLQIFSDAGCSREVCIHHFHVLVCICDASRVQVRVAYLVY